jgi:hypothetical protein
MADNSLNEGIQNGLQWAQLEASNREKAAQLQMQQEQHEQAKAANAVKNATQMAKIGQIFTSIDGKKYPKQKKYWEEYTRSIGNVTMGEDKTNSFVAAGYDEDSRMEINSLLKDISSQDPETAIHAYSVLSNGSADSFTPEKLAGFVAQVRGAMIKQESGQRQDRKAELADKRFQNIAIEQIKNFPPVKQRLNDLMISKKAQALLNAPADQIKWTDYHEIAADITRVIIGSARSAESDREKQEIKTAAQYASKMQTYLTGKEEGGPSAAQMKIVRNRLNRITESIAEEVRTATEQAAQQKLNSGFITQQQASDAVKQIMGELDTSSVRSPKIQFNASQIKNAIDQGIKSGKYKSVDEAVARVVELTKLPEAQVRAAYPGSSK